MERNDFQYATKVWLTGVLLPPILFFTYALAIKERTVHVGELFLFILFSGIVSMPSWLLLSVITSYINDLQIGMPATKAALVFISFILTLLPFFVLNVFLGSGFQDFIDLLKTSAPYVIWLSICAGLVSFKLNPALADEELLNT